MLHVSSLTRVFVDNKQIAGGVRNISFDIARGSFFSLLGPSGCGKTTTLRCIAGLEQPDSGSIALGERILFDAARGTSVAMSRRNIGMVFQSYAIWPHMTVAENVAFPLVVRKERKYDRRAIERLVACALETVNLAGYQARPATQLSGGEQQRVALARAIVAEPQLLLLDEPLSNLDANLREEMRIELKRLQEQTGITTVYVTHDQSEALAMSDTVAVMRRGQIVQQGAPHTVYFRPQNEFVARFIGSTNLLPGALLENAAVDQPASVRLAEGTIFRCVFTRECRAGDRVGLSVRPEAITIAIGGQHEGAVDNCLVGRVTAAIFLGHAMRYHVAVPTGTVQVSADPDTAIPVGSEVTLSAPISKTIGIKYDESGLETPVNI